MSTENPRTAATIASQCLLACHAWCNACLKAGRFDVGEKTITIHSGAAPQRTSLSAKLRTCVKVWLGTMRFRRMWSTSAVTVSPTRSAPSVTVPTCSTKPAATCTEGRLAYSIVNTAQPNSSCCQPVHCYTTHRLEDSRVATWACWSAVLMSMMQHHACINAMIVSHYIKRFALMEMSKNATPWCPGPQKSRTVP